MLTVGGRNEKKIREKSTAFSDIPGTELDWDSADGKEAAGKYRKSDFGGGALCSTDNERAHNGTFT